MRHPHEHPAFHHPRHAPGDGRDLLEGHLRQGRGDRSGSRRPPFPPGFDDGRLGGRGGHRGRGRGGPRQRRGDVRAAILALLAERPMHGYEMIQEIGERSSGFWRPSPGSVYPTLQLLTDEGLISTSGGTPGKRLFELTDEGRAEAAKQDTPPWTQITQDVDPAEVELREAAHHLMSAIAQVSQAATAAQKARAITTLNETRRAIYAILGSADDELADS